MTKSPVPNAWAKQRSHAHQSPNRKPNRIVRVAFSIFLLTVVFSVASNLAGQSHCKPFQFTNTSPPHWQACIHWVQSLVNVTTCVTHRPLSLQSLVHVLVVQVFARYVTKLSQVRSLRRTQEKQRTQSKRTATTTLFPPVWQTPPPPHVPSILVTKVKVRERPIRKVKRRTLQCGQQAVIMWMSTLPHCTSIVEPTTPKHYCPRSAKSRPQTHPIISTVVANINTVSIDTTSDTKNPFLPFAHHTCAAIPSPKHNRWLLQWALRRPSPNPDIAKSKCIPTPHQYHFTTLWYVCILIDFTAEGLVDAFSACLIS